MGGERERESERERERERDRDRDRQTETERETDGQTDRPTVRGRVEYRDSQTKDQMCLLKYSSVNGWLPDKSFYLFCGSAPRLL